jgi:thiosulfate/3-mercaptopyruvate sulfurtransferase
MTAYTTLIAPADLAPHLGDPAWIVFDCRHQLQDKAYGHRVYAASHLPGARFADMDADLSAPIRPDTGRHPLPEIAAFAAWLGQQGVTPATQVVAYDDSQGSFAARLWWMLRYLGHGKVAVLDGGLARWMREQRPVSADVPHPAFAPPYPAQPDTQMLADLREVEAVSKGRLGALVDARAGERYRGEQEPIDPRAGHIPGAVNLPFGENLNADGTFLAPEQLRGRFARLGQGPASIHYCGSGVTACHNLLALAVAGLPPGRLFVGSWSLWSKDPARPAATGAERS